MCILYADNQELLYIMSPFYRHIYNLVDVYLYSLLCTVSNNFGLLATLHHHDVTLQHNVTTSSYSNTKL